MNVPEQLPPADELYWVRERIKGLKEREKALRSLMLDDPEARTGNSYVVEIQRVNTTRTDWTELRRMYPDAVAEFTFPSTELHVTLKAITEDGEIVSPRRVKLTTETG